MTHDPALIAALQELAATGIPLDVVEDLRDLADLLMRHEAGVALLDAQALGVPADAAVDAVRNQFPEVLLMVAGQAAEQNLLASRIADQKVFRFVHKPASVQRLRLFMEAAAQSGERHLAGSPGASLAGAAGTTPPADGTTSLLPIIAGVAGAVVLAVGGWLLMRKDEVSASPPVAAIVTPPSSPQLDALMGRAQAASAAGVFVAADGSSAAELYREAQRLDAGHTAAAAGFERAIEGALTRAEQALLAGQLEQARVTAELLRLIVPDNSRLAFLYTQIERELTRLNADVSQRQALEARQAQIRAAVVAVEQRIELGALLEPAVDNAVDSFGEAQVIGGGDPMVRGARDALVAALLTAADRELSADRPEPARRLVEAAGTVNSSAPGLDFVRKRINEALIHQAALSTGPAVATLPPSPATGVATAPAAVAPPAVTAGAATGSASASASVPDESTGSIGTPTPPATTASQQAVVSATALRAVRRAAPDYPQQALQNLVSGWVEMEFTVTEDGSVRDVSVVESEPRRTFDAAAMAAMRRYRYEPVIRDDAPVEQRARLRMRFTAQDDGR